MKSQRWLLVVVVLCVATCTYVALLQYGLSSALNGQIRTAMAGASDQLYAQIYNDPSPVMRADDLRRLPAVMNVAVERFSHVLTASEPIMDKDRIVGYLSPFRYLSVQADYFIVRGATLAEGRFFATGEENQAVAVVGAAIAAEKGWKVGQAISHYQIKNTYRVVGILEPAEATVDRGDRFIWWGMDDLIFVPFDNPAIAVRPFPSFNADYAYWVQLRPGMLDEGIEQVTACLQSGAPEGTTVYADPRPLHSVIKIAADNYAASFGILTSVIFAVAAVAFSAIFLARVTSRAKEIGIRRAIGMSGGRAAAELVGEALLLSTAGAALAALAFYLTHRLFGIQWATSGFPVRQFALLLGVSVLLGPLGVSCPATVAARISPLSSIRDELGWGSRRRRLDLRQTYALVSLGLAVATVCFASSLSLSTVNGVDQQLRAFGVHDVEVTSTAESPADVGPAQYDAIRSAISADTPIALVQRTIASTWSPDGSEWSGASLVGFDGDIEGALGFVCAAGRISHIGEDEVVLGSVLAESLGGQTAVGKTVLVGPGAREYRVVGVLSPRPKGVVDHSGDRNRSVLLSKAGLAKIATPVDSMARIVIRCPDASVADSVKALAEELLGTAYASVKPFQSLKVLRAMQVRFTGCIFLGSVALSLAVAVAVGIIMIIRMWETRRSMAIQIAVGSTSQQVAASNAIDMLTVTLAATGAGMAFGLIGYLGYMLLRNLPLKVGLSGALITASIGLLIAGVLGMVCYRYFRAKSVAQYLHD